MSDAQEIRAILVALDTSELSGRGVHHGKLLAKALGARLVLFTAVDRPVSRALQEFADVERITVDRAAHVYLERVATEVEADGFSVTSQHHDAEGKAADAIVEHARGEDVDLIVMTTHARTGLGRQLMGSVTEGVLRTSPVPVYVVPPNG